MRGSHPRADPLDQRPIDLLWRQRFYASRARRSAALIRGSSRVQDPGPLQLDYATLVIAGRGRSRPPSSRRAYQFVGSRSAARPKAACAAPIVTAAHGDRAGDEIRPRRQRVEVACRVELSAAAAGIDWASHSRRCRLAGPRPRQRQRRDHGDGRDHRHRGDQRCAPSPAAIPVRPAASASGRRRGEPHPRQHRHRDRGEGPEPVAGAVQDEVARRAQGDRSDPAAERVPARICSETPPPIAAIAESREQQRADDPGAGQDANRKAVRVERLVAGLAVLQVGDGEVVGAVPDAPGDSENSSSSATRQKS